MPSFFGPCMSICPSCARSFAHGALRPTQRSLCSTWTPWSGVQTTVDLWVYPNEAHCFAVANLVRSYGVPEPDPFLIDNKLINLSLHPLLWLLVRHLLTLSRVSLPTLSREYLESAS